jgi:hypothetical protein
MERISWGGGVFSHRTGELRESISQRGVIKPLISQERSAGRRTVQSQEGELKDLVSPREINNPLISREGINSCKRRA